ncbi:thiol:disulfide interchange protein DsbD [Polaribacter pacificus]|uniref:Thiol:disulfide interchange protein DsbD n=1 Tax=Polaribacter pacificus TaxID=1775173 RepID=A0A917HXT4_9FLAO|nr:cytochrome c biogenesis protein CcdA [Polaribacter pacificus]GGG95197.1 thiol:disulfide interchange protein DsbD [Polaribacter pacificus]
MKKIVLAFILLISGWTTNAQIQEPVTWDSSIKKINELEYDIILTATIEKEWHLYSQYSAVGGALAMVISKDEADKNFELVGKAIESDTIKKFNDIFGVTETFFNDKAVLKQRIKLANPDVSMVSINLFGQVCKQVCIQLDEDFSFKLNSNNTTAQAKTKNNKTNSDSSNNSLLSIFIIAFFSGFAALLTPCVFPMIPMTVSFFTKQSKTKAKGIRNAIIYGLSIIVIYVLLGTLVSLVFGADALNALSTNVWFNLIFFLLLIVFAVSFLGAFEIVLPSSWGTKVDAQADRGGLIGIFFMALALAIVSFSCTGPIVGTLLVEAAAGGSQIGPIVGMLGFSLAIAIPFALFAAFPGWLNSLPKSGGWLNTVKVVLGFLELALAFKFLSQADMVLQLHLLEREVFIAIWITIFGALAFYLFGKIKLPHDSPLEHISVGRLSLGLIVMSFTVYMIPGLWGAPLNLISAFPPPQHYSESPYGVGFSKIGSGGNISDSGIPDGAHLMAPHDILAFNDYDKGLAYAKKVGKPVLLDFTGYACVNCRKMEQNVWAKPKVLSVLKGDVVLISLYVDDKRKLKDNEIVESKLKPGKMLKTIGKKWSELQAIKYNTNAQPFYVLMDHNEKNLNNPVAYTPDVEEYYNWLKDGINKFK